MADQNGLTFDTLATSAAVADVYRQVFAVLANEKNAMIDDAESVNIDEGILDAFGEAGHTGLTVDQLVTACGHLPEALLRRRFDVLRSYRAVVKAKDRPNEQYYQATFAPYVMLLFLRRIGESGGQAELHRMLCCPAFSMRM